MKFLKLAPLLCLLVLGCQQSADTTTQTAATTPPAPAAGSPAPAPAAAVRPAQRFLQVAQGAWINTAYLDNVVQTRSPLQALASFHGPAITELVVPGAGLSDTLAILLGYNNHEGGSAKLLFAAETRPGLEAVVNFDEPASRPSSLRVQMAGPDTLLVLTVPAETGRGVSTTRFRNVTRLRPASDELEKNMVYKLNQLLFRGSYRGIDSTGRPVRVQLSADGRVQGLGRYTQFTPQFDFTGPYSNLDYLMLDSSTPHRQDLIYAFRADTLRLYQMQQDTTKLEIKRGRLLYTLTRNK